MSLVSEFVDDLELRLVAEGHRGDVQPRDAWRTARKRFKRRWLQPAELARPRFFCQNSGCCGSTYIVELLKDNGIARCFHEKAPDFNQLGVSHYDQPQPFTRLTSLLRYTRWDVFFEANNRLFSLSRPLAHAFPGARFIHLHRDGRAAVASAMSKPDVKSYQQANLRFRGTLAGDHDASPLVRCCRYWNNMNRRILDDLETLESLHGTHLSLSFDDLVAGRLEKLERFMDCSLDVNRRDAVNQGRVRPAGRYPAFAQWSANDQRMFWDICGETMHRLGYA
ncbi:MAG: sulfotransferase [Pirellulaceae bacterium]